MKGKLVTIVGSMYGRKSLELIEEIKNWEYMEIPYLAFSPVKEKIFSRGSNVEIPAVMIDRHHPGIISYHVATHLKQQPIRAVAIDEVSFYDEGIVGTVRTLLEQGIDVTVAGLDQDFKQLPFGSIGNLMAMAVEVRKRYSICMKCKQAPASTTQRLLSDGVTPAPYSSPLIAVDGGAIFKYECRCKDCHEGG